MMREFRSIISVRSASKIYRMGEVDVVALDEASLDVYRGELLVIVGPSGSGKSTLLNLIGGMDRPTSGQVLFFGGPVDGEGRSSAPEAERGEDLASAPSARLTQYRRNEIGFIFQFFNLVPSLTARENIQVATEIASEPLDAMETLEMVGLAERADHFPAQLSGGEQQRVAIARALAGNPRLILCDEPTGAIDTETSKQILGLVTDLKQRLNKTVVVVTHNTAIPQLADRTARLHDGRIVSIEKNESPVPADRMTW
ncbi:MAG TPA: ABC transporter ATP-binding protein [Sumerlaeia bacterium]|nr:ABC transporter ATP-binding protein [Sumerlaeia bacterium]